MKHTKHFLTALVCAAALLFAAGCDMLNAPDAFVPENSPAGNGRMVFSLGPKTVQDLYFVLTVTPAGGGTPVVAASNSSEKTINLAAGTWNLDVKGYGDAAHAENDPGSSGLRGAVPGIVIRAGEATMVNVPLSAVMTETGYTKLDYNISFPANTSTAVLQLIPIISQSMYEPNTVNLRDRAAGTIDIVPAGYYRLVIRLGLEQDGKNLSALRTQVLRFYDNLPVKINASFTVDDFAETATFDSLSTMRNYLLAMLPNTVDTPYEIILTGDLTSELAEGSVGLGGLFNAAAGRFVSVDMSGATVTGDFGERGTTSATAGNIPQDAYTLVRIVLPAGTTKIGKGAFANCGNLREAVLNEGLTTINDYAFYKAGISDIDFPSSLTTINQYAFSQTKFRTLTIPAGITTLGNYTFGSMAELTEVTALSTSASVFSSATNLFNGSPLIEKADLSGCGATTLPAGMFQDCTSLAEIKFPATLTSINNPFPGCTSLKDIDVSNLTGLTTIKLDLPGLEEIDLSRTAIATLPASAFSGCGALKKLILPDNLSAITSGSASGSFYNSEGGIPALVFELAEANGNFSLSADGRILFNKAKTILYAASGAQGAVTVPASVTEIKAFAFSGSGITGVDLGGCTGVTTIGANTFANCASLAAVTLPSGVTTIGASAFANCGIESFDYAAIGNVTTIGTDTFSGCTKLKTVTLRSGIATITADAFAGCTGMEKVILPSDLTYNITVASFPGRVIFEVTGTTPGGYSVDSNGARLLKNGVVVVDRSGGSLVITDLTTLTNVFQGNLNVTSIDFTGSTFTSVPVDAFRDCANLEAIVLPETVTSIGASAFRDCTKLASVNLGDTAVATIEVDAFRSCGSLTSLVIPPTITSIASVDYLGTNTGITQITIPNRAAFDFTNPNVGGSWFPNGAAIVVSANGTSGNFYYGLDDGVLLQGTGSATYTKVIYSPETKTGSYTIPSGITSIGPGAFRRNTLLTEIVFADTVVTFHTAGTTSFNNCTGLTKLTLSSALTTNLGSTFNNFPLTAVTVPASMSAGITGQYFKGNITWTVTGDAGGTGYRTLDNGRYLVKNNVIVTGPDMENVVISGDTFAGITGVGTRAFNNRTDIKRVSISLATLASIDANAFNGCSSLEWFKWVTGADNSWIGGNAFTGATSLTRALLPGNMAAASGASAAIRSNALNAANLRAIIVQDGPAAISAQADNWIGANPQPSLRIYVPADKVETYKAATGWSGANTVNKITDIADLPPGEAPNMGSLTVW